MEIIVKINVLTIGNFTIHGYGLMIGIGFVLAILVGEIRARYFKLKEDAIFDIAIIAGLSGFGGAKLLYVIVNFRDFLKSPLQVLGSSGFVVYGGLISGILCGLLYVRIKKISFFEYFDLIMPEIALAQGFGRLGCFMAGCCYGKETTSPIGVVFPQNSLAPSGVKLLPTQLISAGADFINMAVLMLIAWKFSYTAGKNAGNAKDNKRKYLVAGDIGSLYLVFYGIGRFLIEFLRNDHRGEIGIFSTSQFISIFFVLTGISLMIINRIRLKKQKENINNE